MGLYRYATKDLSITTAEAFVQKLNAVGDGRSTKASTILYAVLGKSTQWPDEPTPEYPPDNEQYLHYEAHRNFIGGKKVQPSDVSHVATRYDWKYGEVYSMYRDTDIDVYYKKFYVVTDENNVYKCLYNNKGRQSIVKPTGYSLRPFTTSDGYMWKYMYTISLTQANKFMTPNHIPVRTAVEPDGSAETERLLLVQNTAVNGSIQVIETNTPGTNYSQIANGIVEAGGKYTLKLSAIGANPPSPVDNFYNGCSVYVISGTGAGQLRRIINYSGSTKTMTVNTAFSSVCNSDSRVIVSPTVTIVGDGQGAKAYATVNGSTGGIANIAMVTVGSGYTRAKAYITANSVHGYGASANVVISPLGGHGSNPVRELAADRVLVNVQFTGQEGISANGNGYIPSNTEFRTITLLADPVLKVDANNSHSYTEHVANTSNSPPSLRFTTRIVSSYNEMDGSIPENPFTVGDILTNSRNILRARTGELEFVTELSQLAKDNNALRNALRSANGQIVYIKKDETESDPSFYTLYINNVNSYSDYIAFTKDDILVKSTSETPVATVESIKGPEANTYSGEIIFTENVQSVLRDVNQIEDIKIILDF